MAFGAHARASFGAADAQRNMLLLSTPPMSFSGGSTKPNVLLMVADDMGFADSSYAGNKHEDVVKTPNLRAMATSGLRLRNHHVQPVCSPTRATLLTGRHVLRYGLQNTVIWPQDAWALPKNETFLSEAFHAAGYRTAQFGKRPPVASGPPSAPQLISAPRRWLGRQVAPRPLQGVGASAGPGV